MRDFTGLFKIAGVGKTVGKIGVLKPLKRWLQLLLGGDKELLKTYYDTNSALKRAERYYMRNIRGNVEDTGYFDYLKKLQKQLKKEMNSPGWTESVFSPVRRDYVEKPTTKDDVYKILMPFDPEKMNYHALWCPAEKNELKKVVKTRVYTGIGAGSAAVGGGAGIARYVGGSRETFDPPVIDTLSHDGQKWLAPAASIGSAATVGGVIAALARRRRKHSKGRRKNEDK